MSAGYGDQDPAVAHPVHHRQGRIGVRIPGIGVRDDLDTQEQAGAPPALRPVAGEAAE